VEAYDSLPEVPYSLGDTLATLDGAGEAFQEVAKQIPTFSELMTSVWRLARELRKTQRRVNALQHIFIPDYEDTVAFIESALEEREREEAFRVKQLKAKADNPAAELPAGECEQPC
jgi:V/A-type H+-transporting ATPase subunit D